MYDNLLCEDICLCCEYHDYLTNPFMLVVISFIFFIHTEWKRAYSIGFMSVKGQDFQKRPSTQNTASSKDGSDTSCISTLNDRNDLSSHLV